MLTYIKNARRADWPRAAAGRGGTGRRPRRAQPLPAEPWRCSPGCSPSCSHRRCSPIATQWVRRLSWAGVDVSTRRYRQLTLGSVPHPDESCRQRTHPATQPELDVWRAAQTTRSCSTLVTVTRRARAGTTRPPSYRPPTHSWTKASPRLVTYVRCLLPEAARPSAGCVLAQ
jgi:hypothetical protein